MRFEWAKLPYEVLGTISKRIVDEVPGANRVYCDITNKPPSTIEWECRALTMNTEKSHVKSGAFEN